MIKILLLRFVLGTLVPIAVVITLLFMVAPREAWVPGQDYEGWYSEVSGCDVKNGETCDIGAPQVCWVCPVFNSVFDVVSETGIKVYLFLADNAVSMMLILFAFWILYHTYKSFNSNEGVEAMDYMEKIVKMIAYMFVGLIFLGVFMDKGKVIKTIYSYTVDPLFQMSANLGHRILDWPDCPGAVGGEDAESKKTEDFAEGIFSSQVKNSVSCIMGSINIMFTSGVSAGWNLLNYSNRSTSVLDALGGVILVLFFTVLMFYFPLQFLDIFVNIGLVFAMLPLMIISWVFSADDRISLLKDFWRNGINIIVKGAITFLTCCIIIGIVYKLFTMVGEFYYSYEGVSFIFPDFFNEANATLSSNYGTGNFMRDCFEQAGELDECYNKLPVPSKSLSGFLPIIFAAFLSAYFIKNIPSYISDLFQGNSADLDIGKGLENIATGLAKKAKSLKTQILKSVKKK